MIFNKPGEARAVLQKPLSVSQSVSQSNFREGVE